MHGAGTADGYGVGGAGLPVGEGSPDHDSAGPHAVCAGGLGQGHHHPGAQADARQGMGARHPGGAGPAGRPGGSPPGRRGGGDPQLPPPGGEGQRGAAHERRRPARGAEPGGAGRPLRHFEGTGGEPP